MYNRKYMPRKISTLDEQQFWRNNVKKKAVNERKSWTKKEKQKKIV